MTTLATAAEVSGLLLATGGISVGIARGVKALRSFGRFLDSWFGDGSKNHPSVPERLTALEAAVIVAAQKIETHVAVEVPGMLASGKEWGNKLDAGLLSLDRRVAALESRLHTDRVTGSTTNVTVE